MGASVWVQVRCVSSSYGHFCYMVFMNVTQRLGKLMRKIPMPIEEIMVVKAGDILGHRLGPCPNSGNI